MKPTQVSAKQAKKRLTRKTKEFVDAIDEKRRARLKRYDQQKLVDEARARMKRKMDIGDLEAALSVVFCLAEKEDWLALQKQRRLPAFVPVLGANAAWASLMPKLSMSNLLSLTAIFSADEKQDLIYIPK